MKGRLWVLLALLPVSVAVLVMAHVTLNETKDKVALQETVLTGDRSAAAGITIKERVESENGRLLWETAFSPETETLAPETEFSFCLNPPREEYVWESEVYMEVAGSNFGIGSSHDIDLEDPGYGDLSVMRLPVADVASRTPAGEERKEVLRLRDYYEYYPIQLDIFYRPSGDNMGSFSFSALDEEGAVGKLAEYFAIEVPENHQVEITTYRDEAGNLLDIDCRSFDGDPRIWWETVLGEEGVFVCVTVSDWQTGEPMDLVRCADGQGIWFIPFGVDPTRVEGVGYDMVDLDGIRLVYPMEINNGDRVSMLLSEDGSALLIYTLQEGVLHLSVLDTETWEVRQELDLLRTEEEKPYIRNVLVQDGLQVVLLGDLQFALLTESGGVYTPELTGQLEEEWGKYMNDFSRLLWDGERLAWLDYSTRDYDEDAVYNRTMLVYLAVCDESGVTFAVRYDNSIFRDPAAIKEYCYYPDGRQPLSLN